MAPASDGEGIIFDTWGAAYTANGYPYQAVVEQTVIWNSGGANLQIFPAGNTAASDKAPYFVFNNTMYSGDMDATAGAQCQADFHLHGISPTGTGLYNLYNNIVLATQTSCGGTGGYPSWAADVLNGFGVTLSNANVTIQNNYFYNNHAPSSNGYGGNNMLFCNKGDPCPPTEASFIFGANTYSDPGLASPASLWSTAPDCTGYTNVATCMNIKYGVYAHVTPSNAPTSIGYQPPGACTTEVLSNGTAPR